MKAIPIPAETGVCEAQARWGRLLAAWSVLVLTAVLLLAAWDVPAWIEGSDEADGSGSEVRWKLLMAHLALSRFYPWLLLAPYLLWLSSRFTLEQPFLARHLVVLLLGALGFTLAAQWFVVRLVAPQSGQFMVQISETVRSGGSKETYIDTQRRIEVGTDQNVPRGNPTPGRIRLDPEKNGSPIAASTNTEVSFDTVREEVLHTEIPIRFGAAGDPFSAGLDFFASLSLIGLGHALHFRRRFHDRERRTAVLEAGLVQARLTALRQQLQPHFLFNTLNSITSLVRSDPRVAEEMLVSLSDLLRRSLDQAGRPWSTVREELDFIRSYCGIQQMRFGDRLRMEEQVDPGAEDCRLPSLLLQPLVENAIQHGLERSDQPGVIQLRVSRTEDTLLLEVADNGVGLRDANSPQKQTGVGLANVKERLRAAFGDRASIRFEDSQSGGLAVILALPVEGGTP
ncbi:MAG TPA: hypothetical protein DCY13_14105 [Verrucomicrobiales bacterium]|nr:hypothetical protein [Verrucomicrobiales bacterium]